MSPSSHRPFHELISAVHVTLTRPLLCQCGSGRPARARTIRRQDTIKPGTTRSRRRAEVDQRTTDRQDLLRDEAGEQLTEVEDCCLSCSSGSASAVSTAPSLANSQALRMTMV